MAKGQGLDRGILQANIHGEAEGMTPHNSGGTCFGPTIAYEIPHELVEFKLHDAFDVTWAIRK